MQFGKRIMARKRRLTRKFNTGKLCVIVIVAALALFILAKSFSLREKTAEYEVKISQLQESIEDENLRTEELEEYETYVRTDEYAEKVARTKLGLVYEGETIFREE